MRACSTQRVAEAGNVMCLGDQWNEWPGRVDQRHPSFPSALTEASWRCAYSRSLIGLARPPVQRIHI